MICPHCQTSIHDQGVSSFICRDNPLHGDIIWCVKRTHCPACEKWTFDIVAGQQSVAGSVREDVPCFVVRAFPRASAKPPAPTEVPQSIAGDFNEAAAVLSDSPKASAALSRRCLQSILHQHLQIKEREGLAKEIETLLSRNILPVHLSESVDEIRKIGNFAAHPLKSVEANSIVEVEPGEAEWCLDTLEGLFDFLFVQPARTAKRKAELSDKLNRAKGKTTP